MKEVHAFFCHISNSFQSAVEVRVTDEG